MRDKTRLAAYQARYQQEHREEIAVYRARYRQKHREELAAKQARYQQEHREEGRAYSARYQKEHREEVNQYSLERYHCAKKLCPRANPAVTMKIICPVCGKTFGCTGSTFNQSLKRAGHPPRYCSQECMGIAYTKHWQQNHSPYAIRIKELTKRARTGGRP